MGFFDNKTVTIFNHFMDSETGVVSYQPTVLNEVDLVIKRSKTASAAGQKDADTAKLFVTDLNSFKKPKEWLRLLEKERQQYFTFNPQKDFFVSGDCSENYEGKTYEEMRELYDDCYIVTGADYYEDVLPHIEVGGR